MSQRLTFSEKLKHAAGNMNAKAYAAEMSIVIGISGVVMYGISMFWGAITLTCGVFTVFILNEFKLYREKQAENERLKESLFGFGKVLTVGFIGAVIFASITLLIGDMTELNVFYVAMVPAVGFCGYAMYVVYTVDITTADIK